MTFNQETLSIFERGMKEKNLRDLIETRDVWRDELCDGYSFSVAQTVKQLDNQIAALESELA